MGRAIVHWHGTWSNAALAACRALGLPAIEREARAVAATLDLDPRAAERRVGGLAGRADGNLPARR